MKKRLISTFFLIVYCLILIKVMVFKHVPVIRSGPVTLNFGGTNGDNPANFVPFKTIVPYLIGDKGLLIGSLNLIGNIALLVPLGFLVALVYRNVTWKKSLLFAIASGLVIETIQVLLHVGIFDIDDVILNALGFMIGYWVFVILAKWVHSKNYKSMISAAIVSGVVAAVAFYIMYPELQPPQDSDIRPSDSHSDSLTTEQKDEVSKKTDLCGGTGGTGQIVSKGDNAITIKSSKGSSEIIKLTDETKIESSNDSISQSDLKIDDRVTVVVYEDKIATAVLVCSSEGSGSRSE